MSDSRNHLERIVAVGLGLVVLGILVAFAFLEHGRNQSLQDNLESLLKKYQSATNDRAQLQSEIQAMSVCNSDLKNNLQAATNNLLELRTGAVGNVGLSSMPIFGKIPNFKLTNQIGVAVTDEDLRGNIWLADIIFTRCAGPCPIMSGKMADLQRQIPNDWPVKFVTLTTDPKFDTPEVLNSYAKRFDADYKRWYFLTGTMEEILKLAVEGLKLTAIPKTASDQADQNDLFIHATVFVLVDGAGRARAVFENDAEDVGGKVRTAIEKLLKKNGS